MTQQTKNSYSDGKRRPGKFVWFEHASRDAKKAQAFYGDVLGWKVQSWGGSGYDMILAGDAPDAMVGGYEALESDREKPRWISYVSVEDVDAAARTAEANGGRILDAPHDLSGAGRVARIVDPQGAELRLFKKEGGDPRDGSVAELPAPRRFFWCELHTTDPEHALSFYEKVLGVTHKTMDMGPAGTYHVLEHGGVGRGGLTSHLQGAAPHWLPYVAVEDPDATLARASKLGGKVCVGPQDIPGVGRFGVIEDPTGAVLAVMKALPPQANPV